jgi:NADH:ubiquinone oxidoreductase subunit B-like Fe-S oxidoreductase
VAGCPPTPENLLYALTQIQERVEREGLVPAAVRHAGRVQV